MGVCLRSLETVLEGKTSEIVLRSRVACRPVRKSVEPSVFIVAQRSLVVSSVLFKICHDAIAVPPPPTS